MSETMTDAQLAALQDVLDHITADPLERWGQGNWVTIPKGADELTRAHLDAGKYHDFELSPETIADLRAKLGPDDELNQRFKVMMPVGTCGTAFCVAGHTAVRRGWTMMTNVGDFGGAMAVPTEHVPRAMIDWSFYSDNSDHVEEIARRELGLDVHEANALFAPDNELPRIWAFAYLFSDGRLVLPGKLPAIAEDLGMKFMNEPSPAYDTPAAVRQVVLSTLIGTSALRFLDYARFDRVINVLRAKVVVDEAGV